MELEMDESGSLLVGLVVAVITLVQVLIARKQAHLQEAEACREQARAWHELRSDWRTLVKVGIGPTHAHNRGFDLRFVNSYTVKLVGYRNAKLAENRFHVSDTSTDGEAANIKEEIGEASAALTEYRDSVRRVVLHLAQVSDLIINRRNLS